MHLLFWIYKSRINRNGEAPIMIRITINSERISFTTNIFIELKLWDKDKQRIKGNSSLIKEYNRALMNLTTAAWNHYNDHIRRGNPATAEVIRDLMLQKNKPVYSLLEVFSHHIENLTKRVGFDISVNTVKKYKTVESKLKLFLIQKMNRSDINLLELSHKFMVEFDLYMKTNGLKHNAAIKNLQQLKSVIRVCIQNGWLEKDPFVNFSLSLKDTERG